MFGVGKRAGEPTDEFCVGFLLAAIRLDAHARSQVTAGTFEKLGASVVAIDPDENEHNAARQQLSDSKKIEFRTGFAQNALQVGETFDKMHGGFVMNKADATRLADAHLKEGGLQRAV